MKTDTEDERVRENQRLITLAFCSMHDTNASHFFLPRPLELKEGDVYDFDGRELVIKEDMTLDAVTR